MSIFCVDIEILRPGEDTDGVAVRDVMVDTGSELTWVSESVLAAVGVTVKKRDQSFMMANGQTITRNIGYAVIRCGEFETNDEVVFAREGDCGLLGARTLEGFNARVDSVQHRLVAAGPMPVVGNQRSKHEDSASGKRE